MKVAALYDIHGNLPALDAVLAEVIDEGCDMVVVGGDVVPGPMPADCIARLRALPVEVRYIVGNGEVDVLRCRQGQTPERVPVAFHEGLRWCGAALTEETARWMSTWPVTTRHEMEGLGRVLFCHATPRGENEVFTERTPEAQLLPAFDSVAADVVVCGHTHMAFDRSVGGIRVINPGSVGMPFGARGAFWASLGSDGVTMRRTVYDLAAAREAMEGTGYPDAAIMRLESPPEASAMIAAFERVAVGRAD